MQLHLAQRLVGAEMCIRDSCWPGGCPSGGASPVRRCQHANPLDDSSEVVKVWDQPFELCGFASVQIKGANKGYGKWVVASGVGKTDSYNGGAYIWVSSFGQSHGRKVAYASAYAKSAEAALTEAGEETFVWYSERLD